MDVRLQQIGKKPVTACTRYSGDDLDIEVIYPSQRKTTKRQWRGNRPMVVGTWCANLDPKAQTKLYLKRARQMGKNLIITSTQWMNTDLMAVSQQTAMSRVVAEQQTNTFPQVISV